MLLVFVPLRIPPPPPPTAAAAVAPPTAPFIVPVEYVVGDIDKDKSVIAPILPDAAALGSMELAISAMSAYEKTKHWTHKILVSFPP